MFVPMVTMRMTVGMCVVVRVPMVTMVQPLAGTRPARVLAEDERFDGDRDGIRRHADAAEVDIIEIH